MYNINDLNTISSIFNQEYSGTWIPTCIAINSYMYDKNYSSRNTNIQEDYEDFILFLNNHEFTYVTLNGITLLDYSDYLKILDILNSNT